MTTIKNDEPAVAEPATDAGGVPDAAANPAVKTSILDLSRDELEAVVVELGEAPYRSRQLWRALYYEVRESFDQMTTLSKAMREKLNERFFISPLETVMYLTSKDGSTDKALLKLPDGELIETVLMRYEPDGHRKVRRTVCVSTQAGCALGCTFCATGQQGFKRQLTVGEIVSQIIHMERVARAEDDREIESGTRTKGERQGVTNVVFMGMGEPLANYENSIGAIRTLNDEQGLHIGARHITVSTVGLVPQIDRLAGEDLQLNLAVSLHAPDNQTRSETMPINRRYPIEQLIEACKRYIEKTNRRIFFEYVLLHGQNDSPAQADALGKLLHGMLCHVNLIPVNPTTEGAFERPTREHRAAFQEKLKEYGVPSTIRMEKGIDINAGCGQLRARVVDAEAVTLA
ncbi:MAG: 23S rRNA (adenine(2503)-C(2))-methyltransferase RlmN [Chloroflexi bacterium]|nr:23S rRNA (adenine(2503)-C(2))-methyltransferase RlmN [Chloroflexota bacterium]MDA1297565.1 23S rRNA (adenine(2503)-C(2))-methyltransferase RlmN [Chloroflexota bacterium]